ncbi:long-chain-fatty-acid--CoA ligase [Corynebacterium liangguodongii]|uniref:Long-chain fatty acid--CoA ligase n=1 Tax=Corynebacterium liangguodongii TaxID=2079535 RepID=A0A2S0WBZ3_9CORY|nr:long-chain-fatty-acid--CoA ligase [Corynebacterium liangguodongii]AWB83274.1 long-chain fatty acid--CoA ligase [Corynebacterium liangguodongii]PWC00636.1 long-chain fatty acid--CoA ligase [Corynebacterium liangguodongii]
MASYDSAPWLAHYTPWTNATLDYGDATLVSAYADNLAKHRDDPATCFFGRRLTYGELDAEVRRTAASLAASGVAAGDRVAIMLPNCPQHLVAFYAVALLGAVAVEHNPLYTAAELTPQFNDHGAKIALVWDKAAATATELRGTTPLETVVSVDITKAMPRLARLGLRLPLKKLREARAQLTAPAPETISYEAFVSEALRGDAAEAFTPARVAPDDPLAILYTSGTTGQPKGAIITHRTLCANALQGVAWVEDFQRSSQRMLGTLPLFHAFGLVFTTALPLFTGSEVILLPAPQIPLVLGAIKKYKPTFVPGVPTLFERVVEQAQERGVDISSLNIGFSGAASLPGPLIDDFERLTGGRLIEGYGLTEAGPILIGNPQSDERRPGYIGLPFPDTDVRIANPDNPEETVPFGEAGEILARGPQIFPGYFNNDEATAKAFHNGWFRTGDMGVMDEEGFVKIVSRIKELIITGGFNVYPAEVEDVIRQHPDVTDAAVVGRPRSDGSEDVVACVTLRQGAALDPEGLRAHAKKNLTPYKVPRTFYHFEQLARDPLGKIRRREVRDDLLKKLEG